MSEKAFDATPSHLEKAKAQGNVARSQELGTVFAFAAGLIGASAVVAPIGSSARIALAQAAQGAVAFNALAAIAIFALIPACCAAAGAGVAQAAQGGGLRFAGVSFKAERLNPAENLKRALSREAVVTASRATTAFCCAIAALVPAFLGVAAAAVARGDAAGAAQAAWHGALRALWIAWGAGAIFAGADYAVQLARWRSRLRMSHEELRRDHKESDGDPLARSRRRSLHRQLARASLHRVKEAAFVITNPTHIAMALDYRPPHVPVPRVLVRAADEAAARVRELAALHHIPLIENVALARQLYASARPGQVIPQETYLAVAEIVARLAG